METSRQRRSHNGLTLIEVLIALAIISIALTAIIKASSQTIRSTHYLQTKTIALWVAREVVSQVQVGIIKLPGADQPEIESTEMLGQTWYWQLEESDTPNDQIKKINVSIYNKEPDTSTSSIINLESYVLVPTI